MTYLIKAVIGESLGAAEEEDERVSKAVTAQGLPVSQLSPTTLEVGNGSRKAAEAVVDSPTINWEGSAVYMEASDPVLGHFPPASDGRR